MSESVHYVDDRFSIQLKDGIVYFTFNKEYIDFVLVDDAVNKRIELTGGKPYPIFSDFRLVKNGSREARERMAAKDAGIGVTAVAVLINSKVHKTIYNFFHSIYKAPAPAKLFTDKEKALKWLEQFKENSK